MSCEYEQIKLAMGKPIYEADVPLGVVNPKGIRRIALYRAERGVDILTDIDCPLLESLAVVTEMLLMEYEKSVERSLPNTTTEAGTFILDTDDEDSGYYCDTCEIDHNGHHEAHCPDNNSPFAVLCREGYD